MTILSNLNESQKEAVTAPLGPVRVLAGAGSGKTRVLIFRIAWLLTTEQASAHNILAVTFTNKAAAEMRMRLENQITHSLRGMWIGTFHSICHRFLRLHWQDAGLPQGFQIMDSDDQLRLCRRLVRESGLDDKVYQPRVVAGFINQHKDEGRRAEHIEANHDNYIQNLINLYQRYQSICQQSGLVDFSEILLRSLETLRNHAHLLAHYQERFQFILVDEFQDTNSVQYAWLQLLAQQHQHLFVVGDDDQSIYGWRGAKIENILNFDRDFSNTTTIRLEQNYRSTQAILEAANHVIEKNSERLDKRLWTDNESEDKLIAYRATDGYDEARFVVEKIKENLKSGEVQKSDIAILYRSNAQSRVFEEFLLKGNIPYRVYGGLRFFDRAEIKDIMSYLRLIVNPNDDVSVERSMTTPPKGIGEATLERVRQFAAQNQLSLWNATNMMLESQALTTRAHNVLLSYVELINELTQMVNDYSLHQFFEEVIERSNLKPHYKKEPMNRGEDRIENLGELVSAADYFSTGAQADLAFTEESVDITTLSTAEQLEEFLTQTTLDSTEGQAEEDEDSVQLMTLHASKGLEFPHVYLVGLEDGLFPGDNSIKEDRLEEERRLAYVGITRAEKQLYLTSAESRMIYGKTLYLPISRFVRDIPHHLVEAIGPAITIKPTRTRHQTQRERVMKDSNIEGFNLGELVMHPRFGEGIITNFEGSGANARVEINFATEGQKILVLSYANLTKIE